MHWPWQSPRRDAPPELWLNKCVLVEWSDVKGHAHWLSHAEAKRTETALCYTIGWLVDQDDATLRVASTQHPKAEDVSDLSAIPRGCVRRIYPITMR